jgi:hypothetical protein
MSDAQFDRFVKAGVWVSMIVMLAALVALWFAGVWAVELAVLAVLAWRVPGWVAGVDPPVTAAWLQLVYAVQLVLPTAASIVISRVFPGTRDKRGKRRVLGVVADALGIAGVALVLVQTGGHLSVGTAAGILVMAPTHLAATWIWGKLFPRPLNSLAARHNRKREQRREQRQALPPEQQRIESLQPSGTIDDAASAVPLTPADRDNLAAYLRTCIQDLDHNAGGLRALLSAAAPDAVTTIDRESLRKARRAHRTVPRMTYLTVRCGDLRFAVFAGRPGRPTKTLFLARISGHKYVYDHLPSLPEWADTLARELVDYAPTNPRLATAIHHLLAAGLPPQPTNGHPHHPDQTDPGTP